jgi:glycosyltransferase involved in cell wall biosynthesis
MIKIAFIIDFIETPAAGTEKHLLMLLNNLDKTKFQPYLICLRNSDWLRQQTFPFLVVKYNLKKLLSINFIKTIIQFIRLCRREKIDIIQTFFSDANIFGTIGAKLAGCKVTISSRRDMGYCYNKIQIFVMRLFRIWTTHYLTNSKAAANRTIKREGIASKKISVIYNGIDLEKFKSIDKDQRYEQRKEWEIKQNEILVGAIANLKNIKNIDSLIAAAVSLSKGFVDLRFVVVGEGPDRDMLQGLITKKGLTDRFHLVGTKNDVIPCLAAFDIAVLCSKSEGFSNSLIEYMAAGLPIVTSNVGGNAEAITHKETGLLYAINDGNGLVNCLKVLIENPSLAKTLGENARKSAFLRYHKNNYIKNHETFYIDILKKRKT